MSRLLSLWRVLPRELAEAEAAAVKDILLDACIGFSACILIAVWAVLFIVSMGGGQ